MHRMSHLTTHLSSGRRQGELRTPRNRIGNDHDRVSHFGYFRGSVKPV
jgi:hypothetical protein